MKEHKTPTNIVVTTRFLYDNWLTTHGDFMWDEPNSTEPNTDPSNHFLDGMNALATEDMEHIRSLFKAGSTPMLMGSFMDTINKAHHPDKEGDPTQEIEIRIHDRHDALIGVVINTEINY